jgi:nitrite reductase/ring-hydroxylating ferredoxin subunit/uncharacterized membrane protein
MAGGLTWTEQVEAAEGLDELAAPVRRVGNAIRESSWGDLLSGTPLRHPAHPALVAVPIGAWSSAALLDFAGGDRRAARRLLALGIIAAIPAVASGLSDWSDTELAEQRVGLVHATANSLALVFFTKSWWAHRPGGGRGRAWTLLGLACTGLAGWLGGHLAYGMGVGVDTNAFETGPEEWTTVDGDVEPLELRRVDAGGVGVALAGTASGDVRALADRCSHRGGPLSDGTIEQGCAVCPWHGSRFDLESGRAVKGPASVPQPVYETRRRDGKVELRRTERRGLRRRAV